MSKPPLELILPPEPGDDSRTASGLDERQIAAEDLRALQALVHFKKLDLAIAAPTQVLPLDPPALAAELRLGQAPCVLDIPRVLKLRIVPLPGKAATHNQKLPPFRAVLRRGLRPLMAVPVRRRRLLAGELSRELERALYQRLYEKYGEAAGGLEVQAVFAHIPPEAAASVVVSGDLREAEFRLPAKPKPEQLKGGSYLLVLQDAQGKLRKLIMRLESHA